MFFGDFALMFFDALSWCSLVLFLDILNVLDALDALATLKRCPSRWKAGREERSGLTRLRQNLVQIKLYLQIIKNLPCKDTQTSMEGFDLPLKISMEASGLSEM